MASESAGPIHSIGSSSDGSITISSAYSSASASGTSTAIFVCCADQIFERINLEKTSGIICVEMMKKITDGGFRIVEVPVHHYHRAYGKSQFFNYRRLFRTGRGTCCACGTSSSSGASIAGPA